MRAKKCCFIFPLRRGVLIGAVYLFVQAGQIVVNAQLTHTFTFQVQFASDLALALLTLEKSDDQRAIIAIDLSLMFLCGVMLAMAAWQADRLCLFLFIIFACTTFIIRICMEAVYYAVNGEMVKSPLGVYKIAYEAVNAVIDVYLMFIAICYAVEIKEHHTEEHQHYVHGDLSGGVSRVLYGY